MNRRDVLKTAALLPLLPAVSALGEHPKQLWQGFDFGSIFPANDRLSQGPFDIDQDDGWQTISYTTPSEKPLRNPGI